MTIAEWLVESMSSLHKADVPNGRREAIILLSDLFQTDKSWIHTHPEHNIDDLQLRELTKKLNQRLDRIPLAYIRGFSEFYGRDFMVNSHVLIPRPESESFIELVKTIDLEMPWIADIGAGSGCLGVTAAIEMPEATVHLYDIDTSALAIANYNGRNHGLALQYYEADLLGDLRFNYEIILANLPYVPKKLVTSPEITKEPSLALFSGVDGLSHYRKFWRQVRLLDRQPRYILTESLERQHGSIETLAKNAGYKLLKTDVLVQMFTVDRGKGFTVS